MKNEFILKTLLSRVAKGDYASFRELFDIQYATVNRFVGYFLILFVIAIQKSKVLLWGKLKDKIKMMKGDENK
jgi:hypothetical protein